MWLSQQSACLADHRSWVSFPRLDKVEAMDDQKFKVILFDLVSFKASPGLHETLPQH